MKNENRVQWVTRLHSNGEKVDSFTHLCPECKYEYQDQHVNGESVCPNCGVEMYLKGEQNESNVRF
jgi:predicted Zn-ribbon and HTH transcriptional regulator